MPRGVARKRGASLLCSLVGLRALRFTPPTAQGVDHRRLDLRCSLFGEPFARGSRALPIASSVHRVHRTGVGTAASA